MLSYPKQARGAANEAGLVILPMLMMSLESPSRRRVKGVGRQGRQAAQNAHTLAPGHAGKPGPLHSPVLA